MTSVSHLRPRTAKLVVKTKSFPCLSLLQVVVLPGSRKLGVLRAGAITIACALGRSGAQIKWREGDGRTPLGVFALRKVHFRADRLPRPRSKLSLRAIRPKDWWCDRVDDRAYNRLVRDRAAPKDSEEYLQRSDGLYDVVVEIGFNDQPVIRGKGSGIFWHVAREGYAPTAGCIATSRADLLRLLPLIGPKTRIKIG